MENRLDLSPEIDRIVSELTTDRKPAIEMKQPISHKIVDGLSQWHNYKRGKPAPISTPIQVKPVALPSWGRSPMRKPAPVEVTKPKVKQQYPGFIGVPKPKPADHGIQDIFSSVFLHNKK